MASVVITEFMDAPAVAALSTKLTVTYDPGLVDQPERLRMLLASADAVIVRNRTQVDRELLASAPRLQAVGRLGVGLDNIDVPACAERSIKVIPATGANAQAVAEYVMATTLMLVRGAYQATTAVAHGQWPRAAFSNGHELHGKVMGLVGFGTIGRLVSDLVKAFGMHVIAFDPALPAEHEAYRLHKATCCPNLELLLNKADVVSLHVPLTPSTRHLFDAKRLAQMKPTALLINTARGGIIDEHALIQALREERLGGAALDVFDHEPPLAGQLPADLPQLILTPHIAGLTQESNARVSTMIAERIIALFNDPTPSA
ncbi:MAG: 3-phosphoglycerate dehydrogenase [Betaproteobacteria bacterium]|jgi:(S)-sulfolactate dehydrogenase|nr:3-phosphoglycerate dehydrogenase [Betaproteobacteria bacterium]